MKKIFQGFIYTNSKDLDIIIRFFDAFLFSFFYFLISFDNNLILSNDVYIYSTLIFLLCLIILPLNGIYKSFRVKKVSHIFQKVLTGNLKILVIILFLNYFSNNKIFINQSNLILWFSITFLQFRYTFSFNDI